MCSTVLSILLHEPQRNYFSFPFSFWIFILMHCIRKKQSFCSLHIHPSLFAKWDSFARKLVQSIPKIFLLPAKFFEYNNNRLSAFVQVKVGYGEGSMYAHLTLPCEGKKVVFDRSPTQEIGSTRYSPNELHQSGNAGEIVFGATNFETKKLC